MVPARQKRLIRRWLCLAVVAGGALTSPAVRAHSRTTTWSEIVVHDHDVDWRLRVRVADLLAPLGLPESSALADVQAKAREAAAYLAARLAVREGDDLCMPTWRPVAADGDAQEPSVAVLVHFACPRHVRSLRARYDLFFDLDDLHSGFASIRLDSERVTTTIFRRGMRELAFDRLLSPWQEARDYLVLGCVHIFTGHDHLAFLVALLLGAVLLRRSHPGGGAVAASPSQAVGATLKLVTAFTAAHSITLVAAALRPGRFPTAWVEPAIALSVAWVGIENLLPLAGPRRRWPVVFVFGLVHGFGFASGLREIGLPRVGLVRSLLAFNVGVELGQLTAVVITLPLLSLVARRNPDRYERFVLKVASAVIAGLGLIWFFLRIATGPALAAYAWC